MAPILKLVWGATELSLQGGASGWQLQEWQPKIAQAGRGAGPVVEEVLCLVQGSSHNDLATQVQALHAMQARCRAYIEDQAVSGKVWLHTKLDGETGERRALVRRLDAVFSSGWYAPEIVSYLCTAALSIEREPFWEATTQPAEVATASPISTLGGMWDYTSAGDVGGDAPARLSPLTLSTASANTLDELWIGFRSAARHGTVANFAPLWEIENGTPDGSGETTETTDATASPGSGTSKAVVAFTDTTWKVRTRLYPLLTAASPEDQFGRFVLLLRAKVASGTVADVKLKYGYNANIAGETDPVRISATSWTLHEIGQITLPFRPLRATTLTSAYDMNAEIDLWARRVSGAGNLDLDCIVAAPTDEYFLRVHKASITAAGAYPKWWHLAVAPEGPVGAAAYGYTAMGYITAICEVEAGGSLPLGVPAGDGRLVIAAAQASGVHTLADTVSVAAQWWTRYASLRGSG